MKQTTASLKNSRTVSSLLREHTLTALLPEADPLTTLQSGRVMARAWSKELPENKRLDSVQNFIRQLILIYWQTLHEKPITLKKLPSFQYSFKKIKLDNATIAVANALGRAVSRFGVNEAAFHVGTIYTSLLPDALRSKNGIYYTPPVLTKRLVAMSESAGVDWSVAKVADPACGGGAFLAPVALKIMSARPDLNGNALIEHLEGHLRGYEIDPYAAWLTQVFLEIAIKDRISGACRGIKNLVTVCNTLEHPFSDHEQYDLVIGNPPYGKVTLNEQLKAKYRNGLFGHANLYGLFTQVALGMAKPTGIVSYLTPTSFLSGEYFKNLRQHILSIASLKEIDFVSGRKGIFEDVLQETMLAVYKKEILKQSRVAVNEITTSVTGEAVIERLGIFSLRQPHGSPWILPRNYEQCRMMPTVSKMNYRLADYGYKVSTGQLVWNRHKAQLNDSYKKNAYPVIWAESVTQEGTFKLRADKKNHTSWFHFKGEDYLLTNSPCLLLQRTTSKEQAKRLNVALLPQELLHKKKAVVIENHLNIISSLSTPLVDLEVLCAFLNSKAVNDVFRAISGSVAVSAYELQAIPMPHPSKLTTLSTLIKNSAPVALIEKECHDLYNPF